MASNVLGQIALSVSDLATSGPWYEDVLGLVQAGGAKFAGEKVEQVTGVEGSDLEARWLIDQQERFQYELFKVNNPPARPRAIDWSPSDEGYAMIGLHVADFDAALARAVAAGSPPLAPAVGRSGSRRVCVKDPDGNLIELMEDDPRAGVSRLRPWPAKAALRFVTLVVPDVDAAAAFFRNTLGLTEADDVMLHGPEHYGLWGLARAKRRSTQLWAGDIMMELVTYIEPATGPKPSDYKLTDLGWLNVAFLFDQRSELRLALSKAMTFGAKPNHPELADFGGFAVMYSESPQGFSVEMVHVDPPFMKPLGFEPWDSDLHAEQTFSVTLPQPDVWRRLIADKPVLASKPASESRLFEVADKTSAITAGTIIEFRRGREWWLEKILSATPESSITLKNLSNGVITRCTLSGDAKSSTLITLKLLAVPQWTDADRETSVELEKTVDELAREIKTHLPAGEMKASSIG